MKFTKLDLTKQLDTIVKTAEKDLAKPIYRDGAGGEKMKDKYLKSIVEDCAREIKTQTAIFEKEETSFHDTTEGRLGLAKDVVKEVEECISQLESGWEKETYTKMLKQRDRLAKFVSLIDADAAASSAHDDLRGSSPFGNVKLAEEVLGKPNVKKLTELFKSQRAGKLSVAAAVKGFRLKLTEYVEQVESNVATASKLKNKGPQAGMDDKAALTRIETAKKEILKWQTAIKGDIERQVRRMKKFVSLTDPHKDPAVMKAAESTWVSASVNFDKHEPQLKTAETKFENLKKILSPVAKEKAVAKELDAMEKTLEGLKDLIKDALEVRDEFAEKFKTEQAKVVSV
jgi:hypothetical protein